jgi:hypothetical protein
MLLNKILKLNKWQDRLTIIVLNILLARPIYGFGQSVQLSHQTDILPPSNDIRRNYSANILFNVIYFIHSHYRQW